MKFDWHLTWNMSSISSSSNIFKNIFIFWNQIELRVSYPAAVVGAALWFWMSTLTQEEIVSLNIAGFNAFNIFEIWAETHRFEFLEICSFKLIVKSNPKWMAEFKIYLVKHHTLVVADPPAPILMKDPPSVFLAIKQCKNLANFFILQ